MSHPTCRTAKAPTVATTPPLHFGSIRLLVWAVTSRSGKSTRDGLLAFGRSQTESRLMDEQKSRRDPNDRPIHPETRLSLKPLTVKQAADALLRTPPMPPGWKPAQDAEAAPPKRRRKTTPAVEQESDA